MANRKQKIVFILGLAASIAMAMPLSHAGTPTAHASADIYGQSSHNTAVDKVVTLRDNMRWVNVNDGDTVEFKADGKSFIWHFDTLQDAPVFSLAAIAPADLDVGKVLVYVAANPLYKN
jgi:hypothetical protein